MQKLALACYAVGGEMNGDESSAAQMRGRGGGGNETR